LISGRQNPSQFYGGGRNGPDSHAFQLRDKEKMLAIEEALEKVREGTYGVCEECGDEIGAGRLKAMPLAKLCIPCQSTLEKEQAHHKFGEERLDQPLVNQVGEEMD